ncbi:uncharacterized protein LOC112571028 isoform X2 [Pomacea canaliculata]|uniref:uncharacterized protein LOC112571028 isoform X2 n=1 Tax=Pomacea canaliculata TaxID=400727 RepID=UPI000D730E64|nr:uncharacterized protein LOC112571028 isoform X2 [Pomacea canaliculata]
MTPWLVFTMLVLLATQYISSKPASPEPSYETSTLPPFDCDLKWTCRDYSGNSIYRRSYFVVKGCACDDLCPFFSDCCPDYGRVFLNESAGHTNAVDDDDKPGVDVNDNSSPSHQALGEDSVGSPDEDPTTEHQSTDRAELLRQYGLTKDMFTCIYDTALSSVDRVSVVSRCPESWRDRALADLCLTSSSDDLLARLPVSGDITLVVYRNMFCAICHKEPFRYWRPSVNCSSREQLPFNHTTDLTDVFTSGANCTMHFMPPALHFHLRPCFEAEIISNCSQTYSLNSTENRKIASRCMDDGSDYTMVYSYTQAYRNKFCAFCNNVSTQDLSCDLFVAATEVKDPRSRLPYSFSILLDINIHKKSTTVGIEYTQLTDERDESFACETGQVFDPFRSVCREVACAENMYFRDNQCVQAVGSTSDYGASNSSYVTRVPSPLSPLMDCLPILLNDTEFQIDENGSLQLLDTGLVYDKTQYYITESGTFLCVNYTQNYTRTVIRHVRVASFTFSVTEGLVSACGLGVSLLAWLSPSSSTPACGLCGTFRAAICCLFWPLFFWLKPCCWRRTLPKATK